MKNRNHCLKNCPEDWSWWRLEDNQEINSKPVPSDIRWYYMWLHLGFSRPVLMSLFFGFTFVLLQLHAEVLYLICFFRVQTTFVVSFTQQRLPSGQPAIKLRLVESCSHGWPSGTYSHLHTESVEISQSDYWVSHLEPLRPNCSVCSYEQLWNKS